MSPSPSKRRWRYRSSISGLWVTLAYALRHPRTTIRERVKGR